MMTAFSTNDIEQIGLYSDQPDVLTMDNGDGGPLQRIGEVTLDNGAEINAFDAASQKLFVVSGASDVQVVDLSDPTQPASLDSIDLSSFGAGANSVAISNGIIAVAVEADPSTSNGTVVFLNSEGEILGDIEVGALPDMVTFTPDGMRILVANEGEPEEGLDPEGSISIIDLAAGFDALSLQTADFSAFDGQEADLRAQGIRIFPDKTVSQDLEPEFISVSPDGTTAFVTLQENNAFAVLDLASETVSDILPLGVQDFSRSPTQLDLGVDSMGEGNTLDPSDRDGGINLDNFPVFGLLQPDAIASYETNGQTYYITANEGDVRDEDARVGDLTLDPTAFPEAAVLQQEDQLGRLQVSTLDGDRDGDGDFDELFAFGGRSFSIWDEVGNLVFDSGDQIAQITAELAPELFNADDGDPAEFDTRSDNQGAEPEAVTVGQVGDRTYAFIGLERAGGGVFVYDVTHPTAPDFLQYIRDDADIAPEGLTFISAADSPNGDNLLVVSNEESETVALYTFMPADGDNDQLTSYQGQDQPLGGLDKDLGYEGRGPDLLVGNMGNDLLTGGADLEQLFGGPGADTLGGARDQLYGGGGADILALAMDQAPETLIDFNAALDILGVSAELTLGQLSVISEDGETHITIADTDLSLAALRGITGDQSSLNAQIY